MKKRFLFVSPHPDDAELGIGGLILKLKRQKHKVFMVDLTWGEPTPFGTRKKRKKETQKATQILKVDKRVNLDLENRYLKDTKQARIKLAEKIREFKPDIILCPYPQDAHPDHQAATKITEAARFYAKYTKTSSPGEPHYSRYLFYFFCSHLRIIPEVSFIVDITSEFNQKMKAIKSYRSQFVVNTKNEFIFDYISTQNKYLGSLINAEYGEALWVKEKIKINDLSCLL